MNHNEELRGDPGDLFLDHEPREIIENLCSISTPGRGLCSEFLRQSGSGLKEESLLGGDTSSTLGYITEDRERILYTHWLK